MHVLCVASLFFFFNDTATTEIYTLSLHDALPISWLVSWTSVRIGRPVAARTLASAASPRSAPGPRGPLRSEEHTSELQSRLHLVCRLLLEKKKQLTNRTFTPADNEQQRRARHHEV